jgi:uncharacterized protein YcbK (DUF882 family)
MKLSKNFTLNEFLESRFFNKFEQMRVKEDYEADKERLNPNLLELVKNLQVLRDHLGKSISINISYRPRWYELSRGRSGKSQHVLLKAADIVVDNTSPDLVADTIEGLISAGKMDAGGLGRYHSFTHYDIRGTNARWNG